MNTDRGSVPIEDFDRFYRSRVDPYDMTSRWYEQRKRAITLAALPRERYSAALEVACGEGALTLMLAPRCDRLRATDGSTTALERARAALEGEDVELTEQVLPAAPPAGPYDLVVLAEVGYFLAADDLRLARDRLLAALGPDGDLVAVHWRHPSADYPLDGPRVHAVLAGGSGLDRLVHHEDADFVLDVWRVTGRPV